MANTDKPTPYQSERDEAFRDFIESRMDALLHPTPVETEDNYDYLRNRRK